MSTKTRIDFDRCTLDSRIWLGVVLGYRTGPTFGVVLTEFDRLESNLEER